MSRYVKLGIVVFTILAIAMVTACSKEEKVTKQPPKVNRKVIPKNEKPGVVAAKDGDGEEAAVVAAGKQPGDAAGAGEQLAKPDDTDPALDLYNPAGKINPFAPLFEKEHVVAAAKQTKKRRRRGHLTPLEKVDLSQLTLLGTIMASSGNRAMVADSSGKGYVVTAGTYIGMSSGRVVSILKDRIVVEEEVENILGKISLRKRELKLQKPLGE
jgi:type IV pilus assembly protein PilP